MTVKQSSLDVSDSVQNGSSAKFSYTKTFTEKKKNNQRLVRLRGRVDVMY